MHGSVVVSTDALQLEDGVGFDFMEFPHNCGSLLLPFKEIAACMFVSEKPFMNGQCPG